MSTRILTLFLFITGWSCCIRALGQEQEFSREYVDSMNVQAVRDAGADLSHALATLGMTYQLSEDNHYLRGQAISRLNQGIVFQRSNLREFAQLNFQRALELGMKAGDKYVIAKVHQQTALKQMTEGRLEEAEQLLRESLDTLAAQEKKQDVIDIYNSLAEIYMSRKLAPDAQRKLDSALALSKTINYGNGIRETYSNLAKLALLNNNPAGARDYYRQSIQQAAAIHDPYGSAQAGIQLAKLSGEGALRDISQMTAYAEAAYRDAVASGDLNLQGEAIQQVIDAYRAAGQTPQVIESQQKLVDLLRKQAKTTGSEVVAISNQQQSSNAQDKEKQEQLEKNIHNQQLFLMIAVGSFLLLLITGIPLFLNYRKARKFSVEVSSKNRIIEDNAHSLDQLNRSISQQNTKLEEENKMKDKLLSIISHDLRHPLVNTKSILDLINLNLVSPEEVGALMEQLESQYIRSISLLDNLLFWIRGQMLGLAIDRVKINMSQLVNALVEEQRSSVQNKNIVVNNNIDPSIDLMGEREMLKIIFRNLLTNAVKFTPENGHIDFNSATEGNKIIVSIKDSGIGMNAETLEKVNARQYFSSKGTSNEKGSGFGLILVRDLVSKHQGDLRIDSEPGKGSTFTVTFET